MRRQRPTPKQIALWRFEVIEALLDKDLSRQQRARLLRRISRAPLRWPDGLDRRPSPATLYRWLTVYQRKGLDGLQPRPRLDKGRTKKPLPEAVIEAALRSLQLDPRQPWTFLRAALLAEFPEVAIARSTLYRLVRAHPDYQALVLARRANTPRRRTRFVASRVHQRWQCDAKGPFAVRLTNGVELKAHTLTILDDASRAVLASIVVASPNLAAAVRAFRMAAERWGLPEQYYADRGSIFDAPAFRAGLAQLGVRRNWTRARNPQAHGKIEAWHRVLGLWFVKRLHAQQVVDLVHLGQLLDAMIAVIYQPRRHRELRQSPQEVLQGRVSEREVARKQLYEVFLEERLKKAHRVTGEVVLQGGTWLVPEALRGQRCRFLLDPAQQWEPVVVEPRSERQLPLRRAHTTMETAADEPVRWGEGPLQKLYDSWAGKVRPVAEAGFGLPELYQLLASAVGRHVPQSQREAAEIQRFYREHGPLPRQATQRAFAALACECGPSCALVVYLDALAARIHKAQQRSEP